MNTTGELSGAMYMSMQPQELYAIYCGDCQERALVSRDGDDVTESQSEWWLAAFTTPEKAALERNVYRQCGHANAFVMRNTLPDLLLAAMELNALGVVIDAVDDEWGEEVAL